MSILSILIYTVNAIPIKIPIGLSEELRQADSKIYMEEQSSKYYQHIRNKKSRKTRP